MNDEYIALLKAEALLRDVGADTLADAVHAHIIALVRDEMNGGIKVSTVFTVQSDGRAA